MLNKILNKSNTLLSRIDISCDEMGHLPTLLFLFLTSYLMWYMIVTATFSLPLYKKKITTVPPQAMHHTIDGTQRGGPTCTYHISL